MSKGDKVGKNIFDVAEYIENNLDGYEVRVTVLGHVQRGGSPSCRDRIFASRLGVSAIDYLLKGKSNMMVGIRNNKVVCVPLAETIEGENEIDTELIRVADITSI